MTLLDRIRLRLRDAVKPIFVFMVAAAMVTPAMADWSVADMNETIKQTNFVVNDGCSGTLIDKDKGLILTANHCIEQQYRIVEREKIADDGTVTTEKKRVAQPGIVTQITSKDSFEEKRVSYVFKIKLSDKDADLALLQVKSKLPNTMQAKIACKAPIRGDTAYVVGNPMGILDSSITKGIVSSTERNYPMLGVGDQEKGLTQISAGIVGGNSGGAVYNEDGEFFGVPVLGHRMNEVIGFSVPLSDIKKFLMREGMDYLWASCK